MRKSQRDHQKKATERLLFYFVHAGREACPAESNSEMQEVPAGSRVKQKNAHRKVGVFVSGGHQACLNGRRKTKNSREAGVLCFATLSYLGPAGSQVRKERSPKGGRFYFIDHQTA
jgi:hypothetical protein